jgi:putative exosortase-associated protein (TIGR04073 family)
MRNVSSLLGLAALLGLLTAGCASQEQRLGDGVVNITEFTRLGAMQQSFEQTSVFDSPEAGATTGVIHGFDQSVYRTFVGAYQIVTFPAGSSLTDTSFEQKNFPKGAAYPDSYRPGLPYSSALQTDTYFGFSGGDVAPFIPGNRFSIFEN